MPAPVARAIDGEAIAPGQIEALHYLGVVLAQSGKLPEAHRLIAQAAARPQAADIRISLGNVERGLGRFEAALKSYAAALALAPGAVGAMMGRAVTLQSLDDALAAYGAVPPSHPAFLQALGRAEEALGERRPGDRPGPGLRPGPRQPGRGRSAKWGASAKPSPATSAPAP